MSEDIDVQIEKIGAMIVSLTQTELEAQQLLARLEDDPEIPDVKRISDFDLSNQALRVEYEDPSDLPRRATTFDRHQENQMVPYRDPALLPKTRTTHDAALEQLTQEAPPVQVGTTQILNGIEFVYDGHKWVRL